MWFEDVFSTIRRFSLVEISMAKLGLLLVILMMCIEVVDLGLETAVGHRSWILLELWSW